MATSVGQGTSTIPARVLGTNGYRGGPFRTPRSLVETGRLTWQTVVGEGVASFLLIFIGTGSVIMYKIQQGPAPDLLPIALAWAFAVVVIVYAFGHVSGAHANPSVSLGLAVTGKFPWRAVPAYLGAQFVGMMLASLTLLAIFGSKARVHTIAMGATLSGKGFSACQAEGVQGGACEGVNAPGTSGAALTGCVSTYGCRARTSASGTVSSCGAPPPSGANSTCTVTPVTVAVPPFVSLPSTNVSLPPAKLVDSLS